MRNMCRSCNLNVASPEEELKKMIETSVQYGKKTASASVVDERLRACQECPSIQYGLTCMHNGKLVGYHAKFEESTCPFPNGSKWPGM